MAVSVRIPGSCGELVQGVIDDMPFLVTCPINRFARAEATIAASGMINPAKTKAQNALMKTRIKLGIEENIKVNLYSELLEGKGMSSSSADIAAVCYATARSCNKVIKDNEVAQIAADIEPTDGVFCQGIVKFNHINGKILKYLGEPPPVKIIIFDCGGSVDTILFNQRNELPVLNRQKEKMVRQAFSLVEYGIEYNDVKALGQGCTLSALANQDILYKPQLEEIWSIVQSYGAVGINIAHSGTLIGVIFPIDSEKDKLNSCIDKVKKNCQEIKFLGISQLISGGCF
ncbi:hypothetical protein [Pectinatus brassicae]|uniref:L-threonine kinase n=1 Tax=Pectinatus brassicae TaxID=862415 RepID=A0A840UGV1_9FIRM|nr:hypothetical protein [Pectinatus brassicae]MBB5336239.1 L-threonine kinase [Pectinatus brassicae]